MRRACEDQHAACAVPPWVAPPAFTARCPALSSRRPAAGVAAALRTLPLRSSPFAVHGLLKMAGCEGWPAEQDALVDAVLADHCGFWALERLVLARLKVGGVALGGRAWQSQLWAGPGTRRQGAGLAAEWSCLVRAWRWHVRAV